MSSFSRSVIFIRILSLAPRLCPQRGLLLGGLVALIGPLVRLVAVVRLKPEKARDHEHD